LWREAVVEYRKQQTYHRPLEQEETLRIENEILKKTMSAWSDEETEQFARWFREGPEHAGIKLLQKTDLKVAKLNHTNEVKLIPLHPVSYEIAEEIVQEWCKRFLENKRFDPNKSPFNPYFIKGIKDIALTRQNKNRTVPGPQEGDDPIRVTEFSLDEIGGNGQTGFDVLEADRERADKALRENKREIQEAEFYQALEVSLKQITNAREKKAVEAALLQILHGLSLDEIADKLNTTNGYAKQLCHKGRETLRPILADIVKRGNDYES
jgi:RNA polymerase sigma factor (sigma-70 family)